MRILSVLQYGGCRRLSGTSVASPVIAGAVALLISSINSSAYISSVETSFDRVIETCGRFQHFRERADYRTWKSQQKYCRGNIFGWCHHDVSFVSEFHTRGLSLLLAVRNYNFLRPTTPIKKLNTGTADNLFIREQCPSLRM